MLEHVGCTRTLMCRCVDVSMCRCVDVRCSMFDVRCSMFDVLVSQFEHDQYSRCSMFLYFSISPCLHFSIWAGTIAKPVNPTFHPVNSTMSSGGRPRGTIGHARWGGRCKGPIAPTSKTSASPAWHIEVGWPTAWSVTVRAARTYTNGRFYPWRCWSARRKKKHPHTGGGEVLEAAARGKTPTPAKPRC